jgi:hypothetical protein
MRQLFNLLLLLLVVSCTNVEVTQTPKIVNTEALPTAILLPSIALPSPFPSIKPTASAIPCDPFRMDFCIAEGHFILQRPIHLPANDLIDPTYAYASTANGTREPHHGVEFPNPSGTPVYAAADGTVLFAGPDKEAIYSPWANFYGDLIVIQHDNGLFTLYAHLSRIDIQAGQNVAAGNQIGEVGKTGVAIGSHLHFEVRRGNAEDYFATQNPELWLTPAKDGTDNFFGTLMMAIVDGNYQLVRYAKYTIQYYLDKPAPPVKAYYGATYAPDLLHTDENAVLGELPAGHYRIVVVSNGQRYERWVEVESRKLTQVVFVVK